MPELHINGRAVSVPEGTTIRDAARAAGVEIPTLCDDDRLHPAAVCRLCLVEVNGHPHPVAACATPVAAGQKVKTHTESLESGRPMASDPTLAAGGRWDSGGLRPLFGIAAPGQGCAW